jgi:tetratricopeptide (TPR) repeat protein
MLMPEGRRRRDGACRTPSRDFVRAIVLLASLSLAAGALGQSIPDLQSQAPLPVEMQGQPLQPEGQQPSPAPPPLLSPGGPETTLPGSAPNVFSPTTRGPGPKDLESTRPERPAAKNTVPKGLAQQVDALAAKKEFAKAIAAIDEALKTDSSNAELYRLRATVHCRSGNLKLCMQDADRAVEADAEYIPAHLFRATLRMTFGQAKNAVADCETVIKLQAGSPLGYNCRGLANRALREFAQAITDFDEALSRDSKFAIAHYNKGITYIMQNRFDDAIASLSASIDLNPKHDDSYAQRGKARMGLGDMAGARGDFAKALAMNRVNVVAAVGLQALQIGKALDSLADQK